MISQVGQRVRHSLAGPFFRLAVQFFVVLVVPLVSMFSSCSCCFPAAELRRVLRFLVFRQSARVASYCVFVRLRIIFTFLLLHFRPERLIFTSG